MTSIESMFGLEEQTETIKELDVYKIHPYPDQPFTLYSEARLQELAEDIQLRGLDNPIVVRKLSDNQYQIIAGHNRFTAIKKLGWKRVPVTVKNLTDEDAMIYLVQSNLLQRTEIKESEKVKAYALRAKALNRQGKKGNEKYRTLEKISANEQISSRTLSRYIACETLIPELLDLLDEKKISLNIGEQLAKADQDYQVKIADYIANADHKISLAEAKLIVENQDNDFFELETLEVSNKPVLTEEKKKQKVNKVLAQLTESVDYQVFLSKEKLSESTVSELLGVLVLEGLL